MSISSTERELFRLAFSTVGWIDIFNLHERFMLSPGQLYAAVIKYEEKGILERENLMVRLTDAGRHWVIRQRRQIFLSEGLRKWASAADWVQEGKDPLDPYLPDLKYVSPKFFKRKYLQ